MTKKILKELLLLLRDIGIIMTVMILTLIIQYIIIIY